MTDRILGIDLGTSAVKLIYHDGEKTYKAREKYASADTDGWWQALCLATKSLDLRQVRAVGLSSQVGTYIIDGTDCIGWNANIGQDELNETLEEFERDVFLNEISMPHPRILSYPIPRLRYIKKHFPRASKICMPKDFLCEKLTGTCLSDPFSWRGLANLKSGLYSAFFLQKTKTEKLDLPSLHPPGSIVGSVSEQAAKETGIPMGTPVCIGCNDFFSGLLGMGICEVGDMFDITGTSEHLGLITDKIPEQDDRLVCGGYFFANAHYGVTAWSGRSLDLGLELFEFSKCNIEKCLSATPPVFLPYLNGERAPIWDPNAKGVFFGITPNTGREELAYAIMEGVCFSIYHIYENMGKPLAQSMTVAGGAGRDPMMNRLKASLFGVPIRVCAENDTSALGAQLMAAVAMGDYPNLKVAISNHCRFEDGAKPDPKLTKILRDRFGIYKNLYPAVKPAFNLF